mmetsp:Transcript_65858/g.182511  ORF Transcript_65858/g.182511 Transcript_65858/m.182511 type:complete len:435 (+) Transcript_65858:88-1392(+)
MQPDIVGAGQLHPQGPDSFTVGPRQPSRGSSAPRSAREQEGSEEWILKMWKRLDRDLSGTITREELDCEEFHNIVLAAVAPATQSGTGGALYSRAQLNMTEAIRYCVRKADQNDDRVLGFAEFRSLIKTLRDPYVQTHGAYLAFALFDLDCSLSIDKMEFREVMRFFMGHNPTEVQFQEEWGRLAPEGQHDRVTRDEYIRWLRTTPSPVFHQHAPPEPRDVERTEVLPQATSAHSQSSGLRDRPRWNKRFNPTVNPLHMNDFRPQGLRAYFSTSQSLPELQRYYDTYPEAFRAHRARLMAPPEPEPACAIWPKSLSTEGGTPLMLPTRHEPRGLMRDHRTGRVELWDDNWSPPRRVKSRYKPGDKPYAPRALFGELTDVFALSREGLGVKPEPLAARRRSTKVPGGAPLGGTGPDADRRLVRPARPTTLEAEPW